VYEVKNGGDTLLKSITYFDSLGNIKEKKYYENGVLYFTYTMTYDASHFLITEIGMDTIGNVQMSFEYKNDDKGNVVEYHQLNQDGSPSVTQKRLYDSRGLNTHVLTKNGTGGFDTTFKFYYNSVGVLAKEERFRGGILTGTSYNIYDSHNNLIRVDWENEEGMSPSVLYVYNNRNELQEIRYFRVERKLENGTWIKRPWAMTEQLSYNPNGLIREYKRYRDDKLIERTIYKYNSIEM
jgi:antitoxin component YwqK of YwqJK toxin-antitoxin module